MSGNAPTPAAPPADAAPQVAGYKVYTATPFKYSDDEEHAKTGDVIKISKKEAQRITDLRLGVGLVAVGKDGKALKEDSQPVQPPPPPVEIQ